MKKLAILGATGSIGSQTIEVLSELGQTDRIAAITADTNYSQLFDTALKYGIKNVGLTGLEDLSDRPDSLNTFFGTGALIEACDLADEVFICVTGISGLPAFEYCLAKNKKVYLSTKEAMVCGGAFIRDKMNRSASAVVPIDSEISAIYQCLLGNQAKNIEEILLTCSGGPFRNLTKDQLSRVTLKDALKHPNWNMGPKVTVDSASLLNKGLEMMETRWFFDVDPSKITVVVHPESYVHSMVMYDDSSIIAQISEHDMRVPIHYALSAPGRTPAPYLKKPDIFRMAAMHFERPDTDRFPCLALAYEAVKNDGALQIVFNAADELLVQAFTEERIGFSDIPLYIEKAMARFSDSRISSLEDVYALSEETKLYLKTGLYL